MPIPKITEQIAQAGIPIALGVSLLEFIGSRSAPSKGGNGVNYFFEFQAVCGPQMSEENKGRKVTYMVYGPNLEGGGFEDVQNVYKQFTSSITGLTAEELIGVDIEDSQIVGKKVWADISERTQDGKTYKDFKGFYPEDRPPF